MKKWLLVLILIIIAVGIFLLRDDTAGYISPSPTPTITSTSTPTTTFTLTPSPTITPTPTFTPTPTSLPTPQGGGRIIKEDSRWNCPEIEGVYVCDDEPVYMGIYQSFIFDPSRVGFYLFSSDYHLEGSSPNGERLLVSKGSQLISVKPSGADEILLADNFQPNKRIDMSSVFWIPGLDQIVFIGLDSGTTQLFLVSSSGENLQRMTNTTHGVDYIKRAYFDNSVFWGSRNQTNLDTFETSPFPYHLHFTTFSRDGEFYVNYQRKRIEEVGRSYFDLSLYIRIGKIGEELVTEINLTEEYGIGEGYSCSRIDNVWLNPKDGSVLVSLLYCDQNERANIKDYILLDSTGSFIKNIILPMDIYKYSFAPGTEQFTIETKPKILIQRDPWSPDGVLLLFNEHQRPSTYVVNTVTDTYEKSGGFLGDLDNPLWLPAEHIPLNPKFQLNLEDNVYELHIKDDSEIPSALIDVLEAHYSIQGDKLTVVLTLRDLPDRVPASRQGVCSTCPNYLWEYLWGVYIDTDNDISTGITQWDDGPIGWEYMMVLTAPNQPDSPTVFLTIAEAVEGEIRQASGSTFFLTESVLNFNIDTDENTITITGVIPGISHDPSIEFFTFDYNPKSNSLSDHPDP